MGNCCGQKGGMPVNQSVKPSGPRVVDEPDKNELLQVFKQFDVDGDECIDQNELRMVMRNMGQNPTEEEIRAMFKAADTNGDGRITFDEFIAIAKANPMTLSLKTVFAELDVDGDGELTKVELQQAFARMGHRMKDAEVDVIFRQADSNRDGKINFEEFVQMMCQRK